MLLNKSLCLLTIAKVLDWCFDFNTSVMFHVELLSMNFILGNQEALDTSW